MGLSSEILMGAVTSNLCKVIEKQYGSGVCCSSTSPCKQNLYCTYDMSRNTFHCRGVDCFPKATKEQVVEIILNQIDEEVITALKSFAKNLE